MTEPPDGRGSSRLPPFVLAELDDDRRAIADQVMSGRGRLPTPFRVWLQSPELARRLHLLGGFFAVGTSLTKVELELAILVCARHATADYVFTAHAHEARDAGVAPEVIEALAAGGGARLEDPRQQIVVDMLIRLLHEPDAPPSDVFDQAVARLGGAGVAEVLALTGYFTAVGLAMKLYAVPVPGDRRT